MTPPRTATFLAQLQRRVRESPEDVPLRIRLALALDREDRGREALDEWERVLDLDDTVSLAWARVGRSLAIRGARAAARESFQAAFRCIDRGDEKTGLMHRGLSRLKVGAAALRDRASSISDRLTLRGRERPRRDASRAELERSIGLWLDAAKACEAGAPAEALPSLGRLSLTLLGGEGEARGPAVSSACDQAAEIVGLLDEDRDLRACLGAAALRLELRAEGDPSPIAPGSAVLRYRAELAPPCPRLESGGPAELGALERRGAEEFQVRERSGRCVPVQGFPEVRRWLLARVLELALCCLAEEVAQAIFADPEPGGLP